MSRIERVNHAERINHVLEHGGLTFPAPENVVLASWRRCVDDFGLSPQTLPEPEVLESGKVRRMREELGDFIEVADEECRNLYGQTTQSGYVIALTNTDGVILSLVGDPNLEKEYEQFRLQPGAVWSEKVRGTNGMGTCLETMRPVIIHGDDHFFDDYRGLTCTATPISDPHGEVMAILDASSFQAEGSKRGQIHTRALVRLAANFIEYQYFQKYFKDASLLSFHPRSEFLGVGTEAMLALDGDHRIIGANDSALRHLECDDRAELIDRALEEVFSVGQGSENSFGSKGGFGIGSAQDLRNGRRFLTMLNQSATQRSAPVAKRRRNRSNDIVVEPADRPEKLDLKALSGNDPHMAYNMRCVRRVVDKDIYILLNGETGTGKEVFSRAVHDASSRADKPFVALNCAAIPESLIESELFGYKAGAFTGARREGMRGCVLESNGGTLFLDEIGDMPLHLQTRLLRVLETKEVLPLGSQSALAVDLHVVSATHQDLRELIRAGQFRQDLYYRLNGISLKLPALRERQDIDTLIRRSIALESDEGETIKIESKAFDRLSQYGWPGNIRELRNVIRTAIALSDENRICLADLPKEISQPDEFGFESHHIESVDVSMSAATRATTVAEPVEETLGALTPLENAERDTIVQEIEHNRWNMTTTAKKLHMSRSTLYRKLKKYDIPITPPQ